VAHHVHIHNRSTTLIAKALVMDTIARHLLQLLKSCHLALLPRTEAALCLLKNEHPKRIQNIVGTACNPPNVKSAQCVVSSLEKVDNLVLNPRIMGKPVTTDTSR